MIGGDQARGYPPSGHPFERGDGPEISGGSSEDEEDESEEESTESEEFKERRKRALGLIERENNPLAKEFEEKDLLQTVKEMQKDIKILRSQVDATVMVLNKIQVGIVKKFDDLQNNIISEVKKWQTRP